MSDKQAIEWRNEKITLDYPLFPNDQLDKAFLIDAVFYMDSPTQLLSIENTVDFIQLTILSPQGTFLWRVTKSAPEEYMYNDYGKVIYSQEFVDFFGSKPIGYKEEYSGLFFISSLCYPVVNLTVMGLSGDVIIQKGNRTNVTTDQDEGILLLDIDEVTCQDFGCVRFINQQEIITKNLVIAGDPCTSYSMQDGQLTLNDECLPPCFECDERLEVGDLRLTLNDLKDRVAALGG